MTAKTIAFVSKKGGVGKTTSTVSMAGALSEAGRRVLLLDLDPQASASLSLGIDRAALAPSIAEVLLRDHSFRQVIRRTAVPGLDLVTASVDLAGLESESSYRRADETRLARRLRDAAGGYDVVLIDCPPSFNMLTRNAVAASDGYVIPTVPHFLAAEGIESLVESVDRLRFRCQSRSRLLGILPTMVDYRARLTHDVLNTLRSRFGKEVFAVEIRTNVRLAEAPAAGETIFQYDPEATGAGAYRLASEELLIRLAGLDRRPGFTTPPPEAEPIDFLARVSRIS